MDCRDTAPLMSENGSGIDSPQSSLLLAHPQWRTTLTRLTLTLTYIN